MSPVHKVARHTAPTALGAAAALILIVLIVQHPAWSLMADHWSASNRVSMEGLYAEHLLDMALWLRQNLGSSIAPFLFVGLLYAVALKRALASMARGRADEAACRLGGLQLWAACFFGIGVLWTTIGIRDALLYSLGGLDQATADGLTAYELMQRLVEGGVLTALTTTIVGGAGAYVMNIVTHVAVLTPVQRCAENEERCHRAEVLALLAATRNGPSDHPAAAQRARP